MATKLGEREANVGTSGVNEYNILTHCAANYVRYIQLQEVLLANVTTDCSNDGRVDNTTLVEK